MRALTVRNDGPTPWVDLILSGEKRYEFRRWQPRPQALALQHLFAIHEAGRGVVAVARYGGAHALHMGFETSIDRRQPGCPGEAEIQARKSRRPWLAWLLMEVWRIPCVECPGRQGLWQLPPDIEATVFYEALRAGERVI